MVGNLVKVKVDRYKLNSGKYYDTIEFETELNINNKYEIWDEFTDKYSSTGLFRCTMEVEQGYCWNKWMI